MLFFTPEEMAGKNKIINNSSDTQIVIAGGVSGAITNEETVEAHEYALKEYERIRNDKYDIEKIVNNTDFQELQVNIIKNYLFYDKHKRDDGTFERFDPDFYIAQSWHRLAYEPQNIQKHDLELLKHESMELSLVLQGYTQFEAHNITNEKHNYTKLAEEFYSYIRKHQKRKHKETPLGLNEIKKMEKYIKKSNAKEDIKQRIRRR